MDRYIVVSSDCHAGLLGLHKAVERARSSLVATCAATVLIGEPTGARRVLAERRANATAPGPGSLAAR